VPSGDFAEAAEFDSMLPMQNISAKSTAKQTSGRTKLPRRLTLRRLPICTRCLTVSPCKDASVMIS